jgi:hypothetical protein
MRLSESPSIWHRSGVSKPIIITIHPKKVFQKTAPDAAKLWKEIVISPGYQQAISASMACFMAANPTAEECKGANAFRVILDNIAEPMVEGTQLPSRTLSHGNPQSQQDNQ